MKTDKDLNRKWNNALENICGNHGHCWHTKYTALSVPPKKHQICCHCGKERQVEIRLADYAYHGKYKP